MVVVLAALAALATAEVAVRVADARARRDASFYLPATHSERVFQPHPLLNDTLRPGAILEGHFGFRVSSLGLRGVEPDAVIVSHAGNDARALHARGFRPDYAHLRRAWVNTELGALERFLVRHVRLYARLARGRGADERERTLQTFVYVPGADTTEPPSAAPALSDRTTYFTDWMHANDLGSREHARVVAEAARREDLFAP